MSGETILVVDDGKDNRDFIVQYVLEPNGYQHLTAQNGEEGLMMALKFNPDLILLDLQMPRMNGIQVLEQLQERNKRIPVILMTFHGSEEIAVEVYRIGVKDYVKKPYYPDEMLEAINRSLTETRLRRERDALTDRVIDANKRLQKQLRDMDVLATVGKAVTSVTDLNELLPKVVNAAISLTNAEESNICLIENKQLVRRAYKPMQLAVAQPTAQPIRDRVAEHVIRTKKPLVLSETQLRSNGKRKMPRGVLCVPLIIQGKVLGALELMNYTKNAPEFTKDRLKLVSTLADYAAIAIENSNNYNAMRNTNERMRDTFERFVAPSVVQQALTDEVKLGGKRQEISVLFADIRGYTAFSEKVAPEKVVEMLNHYLSVAGNIIIGWEGTLDKFFGDGLMAIFNAPEPQENHTHRATEAALAIRQAVEEINAIYGYELGYSVGVNVGEAVVGYIGTSYAVNYTAIGDTVNLAKRLQESAAAGQILVAEQVVERLRDQIDAREHGSLTVKGRTEPVRAYELIELLELKKE